MAQAPSRNKPGYDQRTMNEISLATLANFAEIVGAGTILSGLVFGWIQIRHYRAEQRNQVAAELTRTFYSRDLARALSLLHGLPERIKVQQQPAHLEHRDWRP